MVYSEFIMFIQGPGCPESKKGGSGIIIYLYSHLFRDTVTKLLERLGDFSKLIIVS